MDDYGRAGHVKYSMKLHLIFVTKYRKQLFYRQMKEDVKQYLYDAATRQGCSIIKMETDVDHVHILLGYNPSQKVSEIAGYLKQYSTHKMWCRHGRILQRHYWKRKALWSDGYFVSSIGQASQATVEAYIQNQG